MSEEKPKEDVVVRKESVQDLAFPEITKLQLDDSFNQLVATMPEHKQMLTTIKESLPEIQRSSSLFYKTQSQFMDNMMTVSAYTPIRNLRQILAEMNKTREAIKEAHFRLKKKDIEVRQKQTEIEEIELRIKERRVNSSKKKTWTFGLGGKVTSVENDVEDRKDELKIEMLETEIQEAAANAESTKGYISGAIRKLTNYTEQYNTVLAKHNLQEFNEADFEREEERYHIMKAFEQAMCAARSKFDGKIDEGNMIYFTQIGINGAGAQREISEYFKLEQSMMEGKNPDGSLLLGPDGKTPLGPVEPSHKMFILFLERMADKYQGSAAKLATHKGMTTSTQTALIQKGDERLLLQNKKKDEE